MTVVVAAKTLIDITVIADSRVTHNGKVLGHNSGVLKLMPITFGASRFAITFGYSGSLSPINTVLSYVIYEKLWHYNRRLVMEYLVEEIRGWIEEVVPKLSQQDRNDFQGSEILVCGFEVFHQQRKYPGPSFPLPLPPTGYLYSYRLGDDGEVSKTAHGSLCVIGEGKEASPFIDFMSAYYLRNPTRRMNSSSILEQFAFTDDIRRLFTDKPVSSIGAPYYCVRLSPYQMPQEFFISEHDPSTVDRISDDAITISSEGMTERHFLLTLKRWVEKYGGQGRMA